jgi:hypothetical protein
MSSVLSNSGALQPPYSTSLGGNTYKYESTGGKKRKSLHKKRKNHKKKRISKKKRTNRFFFF